MIELSGNCVFNATLQLRWAGKGILAGMDGHPLQLVVCEVFLPVHNVLSGDALVCPG
jgi:hypothetical protein